MQGRASGHAGELARLVASRRQRAGLTQEQLAERADLSVRTVRNIESGSIARPRAHTVQRLASVLDIGDREVFGILAATAFVAGPPAQPVPAQLPVGARGFAGRDSELAKLDRMLAVAEHEPAAVPVVVVSGTAGVGKTSLAVHWAHRVRDGFPDGQLYLNLRGFGQSDAAMAPAEAMRSLLDALGVPADRIPTGLDAQTGLYRSLLAERRVLVLLDNVRDTDQVVPLLPGGPRSVTVVTSRSKLTGLVAAVGAHPLPLGLLTAGEARELLARRVGGERVADEPAAVAEVVTQCARLPLALAIVAARAAAHPTFALAALADELRTAVARLDVFEGDGPGTGLRATFSWSYRQLGAAAADLFRLLAVHPGPDLTVRAAASIAGRPVEPTRRAVIELVRANLLTEHVPGRYSFHDLLHAYATEQLDTVDHQTDREAERHSATRRLLDYYLRSAYAGDLLLNPHRAPIELTGAAAGVSLEQFTGPHDALAWFAAARPALIAMTATAVSAGFDRHAWQLAWSLTTYLDRQGRWHDSVATKRIALTAALGLGDGLLEAEMHRLLARAFTQLGRGARARIHLHRALEIFEALDDRAGQADTHHTLTALDELTGHYRDAVAHAERARELYRTTGNRYGEAKTLNNIGWCHSLLGEHEAAIAYCEQALAMIRTMGDRQIEANALDSLGCAHAALARHPQAATYYRRALRLYRDADNRYAEADTLTRLGDTLDAWGETPLARDAWQQALRTLETLDHHGTLTDKVRFRLSRVA